MASSIDHTPTYARVYAVVRQIPSGKVATYGQIAGIVGNCTARMVGYAMAALPSGSDVPWHRVVNAQGKISPRGNDLGTLYQRELLEQEGIVFSKAGSLNLRRARWDGPDFDWLVEHGFDPELTWTERRDFE